VDQTDLALSETPVRETPVKVAVPTVMELPECSVSQRRWSHQEPALHDMARGDNSMMKTI
jgi:hypothetical protein